jgi:transposase
VRRRSPAGSWPPSWWPTCASWSSASPPWRPRIKTAVAQANATLVQLFGVGPVRAAKFLGEVGDIGRFPTKHYFVAHTGTAPLAASSGQVVRHRLGSA